VNLSRYKDQGFVIFKGLFAAEEVAHTHAEAQKIFTMQKTARFQTVDEHAEESIVDWRFIWPMTKYWRSSLQIR
jgi:hypothetical protein